MALGAERGHVLGMVVGTGLRLVLAGMALGLVISSVLGRIIGNQLVGVNAYDPATLAWDHIIADADSNSRMLAPGTESGTG
jgi:ABC-type antimicrobial peptide transport system permease subunit